MTGNPRHSDANPKPADRLGVQLYSIGVPFASDPRGTLRALADMGFSGVEFAWEYGGLSPEELRDLLDDLALQAVGIYVPFRQLADPDAAVFRYADALSCRYLTTGLPHQANAREWPSAITSVREAAARLADRGKTLLYHNHGHELVVLDGRIALDILLESTDPLLVQAELDTAYFVQQGLDPTTFIRRYAGRLPRLHLRDTTPDGQSVPIGAGIVDFPAVLEAARVAGVDWLVYEQNPSSNALSDAEQSRKALRAFLADPWSFPLALENAEKSDG